MDFKQQQSKAEALRKLHDRSRILVLPNAWDVASARIFEDAGFPAIATTSAGVAASVGFPDCEKIDREQMVAAVGRIARSVRVPVTADMEAAYAASPAGVAETIRSLIEAGAVGLNLEDSNHQAPGTLYTTADAVERIKAARAAAAAVGVPIVINARTDVYLGGIGERATRFQHAVTRANAYCAAGADCVFVPGVTDASTIGDLTKAINGPINILATAGTPSPAELHRLGVARVSVGSGPMRATAALTRRIARELMDRGAYDAFTRESIPYAELNALLARPSGS